MMSLLRVSKNWLARTSSIYDAVAPIVTLESVDPNYSFRGNRYGESGDYINCPMDEDAYRDFWEALVNAETAQKHSFENEEMRHFEGCLPVEVIAKRGEKTLLFGAQACRLHG